MMKTILIVLCLTMFPAAMYSQCDWDKSSGKDPFTGLVTRATVWENIVRSTNGGVSFKIVEFPQDTTIYLYVKVSLPQNVSSIRCFNDESLIMLKSGEIVKSLDFEDDEVDCGTILINSCELTPEMIEFLKQNPIEMFRIVFAEGQKDFTILDPDRKRQPEYYQMKADYFIRTLKCFE